MRTRPTDEDVAARGRGGKTKSVRHQLRRTPTETQAGSLGGGPTGHGGRGFPSGPSPGSWAWTETLPESTPWRRPRLQRNSVPRSVPKQRPWPDHQPPPTKPGDIFAFHLRGQNRWTTTNSPPVAPDAHGRPAGSLGGGTTGHGAGAFPPGHRPEAGHGPKHCRKVRLGGDPAYKETQCQGACQSRDPGRITNLLRLNRVTYSLFI